MMDDRGFTEETFTFKNMNDEIQCSSYILYFREFRLNFPIVRKAQVNNRLEKTSSRPRTKCFVMELK